MEHVSQAKRCRASGRASTVSLMQNACFPNVSENRIPLYAGAGVVKPGYLPDFVQSKFPARCQRLIYSEQGKETGLTRVNDDATNGISVPSEPLGSARNC